MKFRTFAPQDMDHGRVRRILAELGGRGVTIGRHGGRRDLVRNAHGVPLPCCWADCWHRGSTKHVAVVAHDAAGREGDTLTYLFCGPQHRQMWLGQLPPDSPARGLIVP
jgi:hypothetical protein